MIDCSFPVPFSPLVVFSRFHTCLFGSICVRQRLEGRVVFLLLLHCFPISAGLGRKRGRKALSLFCGVFYAWPFVDRISTKCIQFKIAIHLTCVFFSHVVNFYFLFFVYVKTCSFDVGIRPALSISGGACLQSVPIRQYFQQMYAYTFCLSH